MKCPFCNYDGSKVIDSRPADDNTMIRRRRECEHCKKRFTTYERIENIPLIVVKKSGQRELYDRNKIYNGIIKSCEKRPVAIATIEKLVDNLERELYQIEDKEVSSIYIGESYLSPSPPAPISTITYLVYNSVSCLSSVQLDIKVLSCFLFHASFLMNEGYPSLALSKSEVKKFNHPLYKS